MIGLRLSLPQSWTDAAIGWPKARVPEDWRAACTKPEIALAEIDRIRAADSPLCDCAADAGYGLLRAVPPGARCARPEVGGRNPEAAEALPEQRHARVSGRRTRAAPQAPYPRSNLFRARLRRACRRRGGDV